MGKSRTIYIKQGSQWVKQNRRVNLSSNQRIKREQISTLNQQYGEGGWRLSTRRASAPTYYGRKKAAQESRTRAVNINELRPGVQRKVKGTVTKATITKHTRAGEFARSQLPGQNYQTVYSRYNPKSATNMSIETSKTQAGGGPTPPPPPPPTYTSELTPFERDVQTHEDLSAAGEQRLNRVGWLASIAANIKPRFGGVGVKIPKDPDFWRAVDAGEVYKPPTTGGRVRQKLFYGAMGGGLAAGHAIGKGLGFAHIATRYRDQLGGIETDAPPEFFKRPVLGYKGGPHYISYTIHREGAPTQRRIEQPNALSAELYRSRVAVSKEQYGDPLQQGTLKAIKQKPDTYITAGVSAGFITASKMAVTRSQAAQPTQPPPRHVGPPPPRHTPKPPPPKHTGPTVTLKQGAGGVFKETFFSKVKNFPGRYFTKQAVVKQYAPPSPVHSSSSSITTISPGAVAKMSPSTAIITPSYKGAIISPSLSPPAPRPTMSISPTLSGGAITKPPTSSIMVSPLKPPAPAPTGTGGPLTTAPSGSIIPKPSGPIVPKPSGSLITKPDGSIIPKPSGSLITKPGGSIIPKPPRHVGPGPPRPPPPPPPPPPGGGLPFGWGNWGLDLGGGGGLFSGFGRGGKPRATRREYLPSLSALTFGIKGKKPGIITGLEQRPILK